VKFATANKFTQAQFSRRSRRMVRWRSKLRRLRPQRRPKPHPRRIQGYDKMSFAEKFMIGEACKREAGGR
jgi:hypothetical protein